MSTPTTTEGRHRLTAEARQLAELARAAGLGDSPEGALRANDQAIALLGSDEETPLLADVLRWQGRVMYDRGRTSEAHQLYSRSLAVSARLGYDPGRAQALNYLGTLALRRGDLTRAANLMTHALGIATRCHETRLVGMIRQNLGIIADIQGNAELAMEHFEAAERTFEATNDLQPLCWVLNNAGYVRMNEDRFDQAHSLFDRALGIARARGDLGSEGILEENRGELHLRRLAVDASYASWTRALEIAKCRGDEIRLGAALKLRGGYERLSGHPLQALETLGYALTLSAVAEDALLGAETLYQFGFALHASGDPNRARAAWQTALEAFQRIAAPKWIARVQEQLSAADAGRYL